MSRTSRTFVLLRHFKILKNKILTPLTWHIHIDDIFSDVSKNFENKSMFTFAFRVITKILARIIRLTFCLTRVEISMFFKAHINLGPCKKKEEYIRKYKAEPYNGRHQIRKSIGMFEWVYYDRPSQLWLCEFLKRFSQRKQIPKESLIIKDKTYDKFTCL